MVLAVIATLAAAQDAEDEGSWIEHFDKKSGKHFYYHSKTRETAWEAPAGAKIQFLQQDDSDGASKAAGKAAGGGSNTGVVMLALLSPIVLPLLGLACERYVPCRHCAAS